MGDMGGWRTQIYIVGLPVPPIRSDFPDHGPNPDFFVETGPDCVEKVRVYLKTAAATQNSASVAFAQT